MSPDSTAEPENGQVVKVDLIRCSGIGMDIDGLLGDCLFRRDGINQ